MFTVLFTAVGRRVELIAAFKASYAERQISARIIGVDHDPRLAPAGLVTDAVYRTPLVGENGYLESLLEICRREAVELLIPLYEPEFLPLDQNRDRFAALGTRLLLSPKSALETCRDKYLTFQFFQANRIKTPPTRLLERDDTRFKYPVFIKPRLGMGSVGARKIEPGDPLPSINAADYLLQEFIPGIEFTLDILADFEGKILAVVPRERIEVRAGEVTKSRTVKRYDLIEQGKNIAEKLGVIGPVNLQCIVNGPVVFWIEINPRFGGGTPLSLQAGVDYPHLLYQLCRGETVAPLIGQFRDNLLMLRYEQAFYVDNQTRDR